MVREASACCFQGEGGMTEATIQFDELAGLLAGPDWRVKMPRREAQILAVLLAAKGRAVSGDYLIESIYEVDAEPLSTIIHSHISKLRSKLKPVGLTIKSGRYQGYALDLGGHNIASVTIGPLPVQDDMCGHPIYLSVADNVVVSELRSLGQRYGCGPQHVAAAIIKAVVAGGLIDAVFDGDTPQDFDGFHACVRGGIRSMGPRQQAVLEWFRSQPPGPISIGMGAIGREIGVDKAVVWSSLRSLCARGHLRRVVQGSAGKAPSIYELVGAAP
jgi:biotin operon repressor